MQRPDRVLHSLLSWMSDPVRMKEDRLSISLHFSSSLGELTMIQHCFFVVVSEHYPKFKHKWLTFGKHHCHPLNLLSQEWM